MLRALFWSPERTLGYLHPLINDERAQIEGEFGTGLFPENKYSTTEGDRVWGSEVL